MTSGHVQKGTGPSPILRSFNHANELHHNFDY
jgi:hypothetical protein